MTVRYVRVFELQVSHFNGAQQYDQLEFARSAADQGVAQECYEAVLRETHGHLFTITVDATAPLDATGFVLEDERLEEIVMAWNNQNLSVHSDFVGGRATTERMAVVLRLKVLGAFPNLKTCRVRVRETPYIYAEVPA